MSPSPYKRHKCRITAAYLISYDIHKSLDQFKRPIEVQIKGFHLESGE